MWVYRTSRNFNFVRENHIHIWFKWKSYPFPRFLAFPIFLWLLLLPLCRVIKYIGIKKNPCERICANALAVFILNKLRLHKSKCNVFILDNDVIIFGYNYQSSRNITQILRMKLWPHHRVTYLIKTLLSQL